MSAPDVKRNSKSLINTNKKNRDNGEKTNKINNSIKITALKRTKMILTAKCLAVLFN